MPLLDEDLKKLIPLYSNWQEVALLMRCIPKGYGGSNPPEGAKQWGYGISAVQRAFNPQRWVRFLLPLPNSNSYIYTIIGAIAHLGERLPCTQKVVGSSPTGSTNSREALHG